jgi:acyl-CoA synthetase (AMP-forming)/AMP-acid ligase II
MIGRLLQEQAQRTPDAVALAAPGRRARTYAELAGQVDAMVGALNRLGAGRGDPVAIVLPNGPHGGHDAGRGIRRHDARSIQPIEPPSLSPT